MEQKNHNQKVEVKRIGGHLKEIITFLDDSGEPIGHVMNPLMVEIKVRDIAQIFVGSFLVASPLCLTEEVWKLSEELPRSNVLLLGLCSTITVMAFVYSNFYRSKIKGQVVNFLKRIFAIYFISTCSVVIMLMLINKFPIIKQTDVALARMILIGFPSIFGAVITDSLK